MGNSMIAKSDAGPLIGFESAIYPGKAHTIPMASTGSQSSAMASDTSVIRICADVASFYDVGPSPSTGNFHYLPAGVSILIACRPGDVVLAEGVSTTGHFYISEGAGSFGDQT